jgi:hypothetical protein
LAALCQHSDNGITASLQNGCYGVTTITNGLVFTKAQIDRLIATNRDFMWNGQVTGARFKRIDGGEPDPRWKNSPGVLRAALVPYDETLRQIFEANHNPASWGGLASTPRYPARMVAGAAGAANAG